MQAIKSAIDELEQASHAFSKALYEATGGAGGGASGRRGGRRRPSRKLPTSADDDAIDAEFEVKDPRLQLRWFACRQWAGSDPKRRHLLGPLHVSTRARESASCQGVG